MMLGEIDNRTPFAFAPLFTTGAAGRPLLTLVVKATFTLRPNGPLVLAEEQRPIDWVGEYSRSSCRYEPEVAWLKPATDVVLIAHARAPRPKTSAMDVRFQVGPVEQVARVFGERRWRKGLWQVEPGDPAPFEAIPLLHEHAFGGWDRSAPDPADHDFEPRNPVGCGLCARRGRVDETAILPCIEDPQHLLRRPGDRPRPIGFGFTAPHWQPRAGFAGTYDRAWETQRAPLLPADFDRRYFNAASPGLTAPGHLAGDEAVVAEGVSTSGRLAFSLPGEPPPSLRVRLRRRADAAPAARLDTVVVDLDAGQVVLVWRAELSLQDGPTEVDAYEIEARTGGGS